MAREPLLSEVLTPNAAETLHDFSDHMRGAQNWRVVGSAAVYFHAGASGRAGELDIATPSLDVIPPTRRGSSFEAAHWHRPNTTGNHYAALIHTPTGTKIDVFRQYVGEPSPVMVPLGVAGTEVPVRSANAQMVASIEWLYRRVATDFGFGAHDKAAQRVEALSEVIDWREVELLWAELSQPLTGLTDTARGISEWALSQAHLKRSANTSLLSHRLQLLAKCRDCYRADPEHPVIPLRRILARKAVGVLLSVGQTLIGR